MYVATKSPLYCTVLQCTVLHCTVLYCTEIMFMLCLCVQVTIVMYLVPVLVMTLSYSMILVKLFCRTQPGQTISYTQSWARDNTCRDHVTRFSGPNNYCIISIYIQTPRPSLSSFFLSLKLYNVVALSRCRYCGANNCRVPISAYLFFLHDQDYYQDIFLGKLKLILVILSN